MRTKLFTGPLAVVIGLVASAFMAGPALASESPPLSGYIEICKDAPAITPAATFAFSVGEKTIYVTSGQCSPAMRVDSGTVTVTEENYSDSGFWTNDWTQVSGITTTAPGAPDAMLVSKDLDGRTADVTVNAGDESQATVVHFTNDPVNGYFEICKDQVTGAGLDGQSFSFDWTGANGASGSVSVLVGGCSFPIYAPAGHVVVTEHGTNYVDTTTDADGHLGIWTVHGSDLIGAPDIGDAQATIAVHPAMVGDTTGEAIVHFRNNSSLLKICKVVPIGTGMDGLPYSFSVSANGGAASSYGVNAFVKWHDPDTVYGCVTVGTFRAGTSIVVTEVPQPGQKVDSIWLEPDYAFTQGGSDYLGQSATLSLRSGETEVFYKDVPFDPQHLKICKMGGGPNTTALFTVTGPQGTAPDVSMTEKLDVSVPLDATGAGCAEAGDWSYIGPVSIAEHIATGFKVTAIAVATPDRLVAGSVNLTKGTVGAYIGVGTTIVTYTNADPPAPTGGSSSSSSSSSSSAPAPVVTATPASQPAPVAPAPAKPTKATVASHVMSVRIVTLHGKRYVSIRMASSNRTARVHLQLIDRHGTVMKNAVRTVKANVTTRILDLPLAKSIVKVRAVPVS